jgi:hypothetical protein
MAHTSKDRGRNGGNGRKVRGRSTVRVTHGGPRRSPRRYDGWQVARVDVADAPVGPDVATPALTDVLAAFESAPRADDWSAVSKLVIPVIPRVRPHPAGYPTALRTIVPPGVVVGFGVDIGPAFMAVSAEQLALLKITEAELVTQALANLLARAEQIGPSSIVHGAIDGVPVAALQSGLAVGSTLVLVPDQLGRLFGTEPRLFVAPMRDLIIGLPVDVEPDLAAWIFEEFASQDPNCLAPVAYSFDGLAITTGLLGRPPVTSPRRLPA